MKYKDKHNGKQNIVIPGTCKLSGEQAEVTSYFGGIIGCKTDLQMTYRFNGYNCSLNEYGHQNQACMDICPLIQKKI